MYCFRVWQWELRRQMEPCGRRCQLRNRFTVRNSFRPDKSSIPPGSVKWRRSSRTKNSQDCPSDDPIGCDKVIWSALETIVGYVTRYAMESLISFNTCHTFCFDENFRLKNKSGTCDSTFVLDRILRKFQRMLFYLKVIMLAKSYKTPRNRLSS